MANEAAGSRKKKKRGKSGKLAALLALLLAFLGISEGGMWYAGQHGTVIDAIEEQINLLPDFDPAAIIAVAIEEPPGAPVQLERDDSGRWQITAPAQHAADAAIIQEILIRLQRAEVLATTPIESDAELAGFGLEQPTLEVELKTGAAASARIQLGAEAVGSGFFARRVGDDRVVTLSAQLVASLRGGMKKLRARELFMADPERVTGVQVLAPDHSLSLTRREGRWELGEPATGSADRVRVSELVQMLTTARALEFLDLDPGDDTTGLGWPEVRMRIEVEEEGKSDWLEVGGVAEAGQRYARRGEDLMLIEESLITELLRDPERLRDRDLLDLPYDRVVRFTASCPQHEDVTASVGEDARWSLTLGAGSDRVPADNDRVSSFLRQLDRLRIKSFEEVDARLDDEPRLRLQLELSGGDKMPIDLQLLGDGELTARISMTGGAPPVFRVDRDVADTLADPELAFRSRRVFAPNTAEPGAIGGWRMRLTQRPPDAEERHQYVDHVTGQPWSRGDEGEPDHESAEAIADELKHLEARDLIARWDGKSRPIAAPPGEGFLAKVRLGMAPPGTGGEAAVREWQLTIYGQAPMHPGLFVATSEQFGFVMLLGEHTVARFLTDIR